MKLAVIDIGSNSIRYMEAESSKDGFCFSNKSVYTTRLAEGQGTDKKLSSVAMERSVDVLENLCRLAKDKGLPAYAYATSAVREASNQNEFLKLVHQKVDLPISILSGSEEARFAYQTAMPNGGGLIDIGGGSFQITTEFSQFSYPIGCVRLRDAFPLQNLSEIKNQLPNLLPDLHSISLPKNNIWKAVGGTATTLGAISLNLEEYDSLLVRKAILTQSSLLGLLTMLDKKSDLERSQMPLLKDRHDVIIGGGAILLALMEKLSIQKIQISDTDGLEGYAVFLLS